MGGSQETGAGFIRVDRLIGDVQRPGGYYVATSPKPTQGH